MQITQCGTCLNHVISKKLQWDWQCEFQELETLHLFDSPFNMHRQFFDSLGLFLYQTFSFVLSHMLRVIWPVEHGDPGDLQLCQILHIEIVWFDFLKESNIKSNVSVRCPSTPCLRQKSIFTPQPKLGSRGIVVIRRAGGRYHSIVTALTGPVLIGSWSNLVGTNFGAGSRTSSFLGDVAR